ncbi:hypothetical protein M885DRAFT_569582, partial [Pelagophyceae sp. CCMP2097]
MDGVDAASRAVEVRPTVDGGAAPVLSVFELNDLLAPILRLAALTNALRVTKHVARAARAVAPAVRRLILEDRWKGRILKGTAILKWHTHEILSCAFSPDGKRILTGSYATTARLWDAETGALVATLEGHTDYVMSCAFSPDGKRIVTASYDFTARLWDAEMGALQTTLEGHTGYVNSCAAAMMDAPTAASKLCCVCAAQNGKHCAKCKSRHYCSKACQLVDWKRGHNKACKQLAKEFQDRLLDELMPEKKPKEAPPIVEGVSPADGAKARLSAVQAAKPNDDAPSWRGTCAICLDVLPVKGDEQFFYSCCCKRICTACHVKCRQHDKRCPLCRAPSHDSDAAWLRRLQKHVDKGNADAQDILGDKYFNGDMGLQQNFKRAVQL